MVLYNNINLPLNNDHLSTTATNLGLLYTSLTVFRIQLKVTWSQSYKKESLEVKIVEIEVMCGISVVNANGKFVLDSEFVNHFEVTSKLA